MCVSFEYRCVSFNYLFIVCNYYKRCHTTLSVFDATVYIFLVRPLVSMYG